MGYRSVMTVRTRGELADALSVREGPVFIQAMVRRGTRKDLGRPRTPPEEIKKALMGTIRGDGERSDRPSSWQAGSVRGSADSPGTCPRVSWRSAGRPWSSGPWRSS